MDKRIMSEQSYSMEIQISARPESVCEASTSGLDEWWTELASQAPRVGEQLVVRFEKPTYWAMTVSEAVPDRSVVWRVDETYHGVAGFARTDELAPD
jgi:hypothetical protein